MKIRIKTNSLRYRLTRSDVSQLAATGCLHDEVNFGRQSLTYVIKVTDGDELSAAFENNTITMFIPQFMVSEFEHSDRVGFENSEQQLYLLVEKDFTCLENVAEDQSDNYPNPLAEQYHEKGN
jgi:hypothetical protein